MRKSISGKYVKCPFCKKWLVPSGDSTKPYACKCGSFAEWEEPHLLRFTKGNVSHMRKEEWSILGLNLRIISMKSSIA